MQHSTPTTNRRRRVLRLFLSLVAVLLIGALLFLQFGRSIFGVTMPGWCSYAMPATGEKIIVLHGEAQAELAGRMRGGEEIPRAWLSCSFTPAFASGSTKLNKRGLTENAQKMDAAVREQFGQIPDGGYSPGGVTTGHIPGSAHYEGRAIDYFFRPFDKQSQRSAGWILAQWAVVHAEQLNIATVIFDDKIWTRNNSGQGWRDYTHPSGNTTNPILRHLDHVHIDVL